MLKVLANCT